MDNQNYKVDIHYDDKKEFNYGDFALGVGAGLLIIPAIYGVYSKAKMLIKIHREKKEQEMNKNEYEI